MPTLSFIIATALLAVGVIALVIGILLVKHSHHDKESGQFFVGVVMTTLSAFLVVPLAIGLYPYQMKYHVKELHSGTVSQVEARIVSDGNKYSNITKEIAFWIDGETDAYITSDVRLTGLEAGDTITLRRQASWVYGGQDYWSVTYVSAPTG